MTLLTATFSRPAAVFGIARSFALVVSFSLLPEAMAQDAPPSPDQIACEPDVHRLCETVFPDVQRVAACLVANRKALSTACASALAHPTEDDMDD